MKKMRSKRFLWAIPLCCAALLGIFLLYRSHSQPDMLTEEQVAALREEYPVPKYRVPPTASVVRPYTLKEVKELYDTFIYGQIMGDPHGKPIRNDYSVRVEKDMNGKYQKGDVLSFRYTAVVSECQPRREEGMWFLMPVLEEEPGEYMTSRDAMFYITDDGYVLPIYDEERYGRYFGLDEGVRLSGRKVEDVMDFLRDL